MSEIDPLGARLAIQNAQFALQKKQYVEARRLAMEAAQLDPNFEDPWLILATLASPQASVAYLQKALQINPHSERATKGMKWALERLAKVPDREELNTSPNVFKAQAMAEQAQPPDLPQTQPTPVAPTFEAAPQQAAIGDFETDADKWQAFKADEQTAKADTQPIKTKWAKKAKLTGAGRKSNPVLIAILLLLILLTAVAWFELPTWLASGNSASAPLPAGLLSKPSLTPTNTFTPTPTATNTPTATPTNTPTPLPTNTPLPTDTPWPTSTPLPYSPYPQITPAEGNSGRWIDVDLTNQMLYAYEGDTVVRSFLVSTGVAAYPTVTGQYHIYVKYVSTLMVGPGYYLPDVPYTMYFYEGYGIHGTYWHNNFGHPMSHGCVNMRTSDAEWMFNWASVGTLVNIHY
jgi:Uncharacterized protein conserved in bacteria